MVARSDLPVLPGVTIRQATLADAAQVSEVLLQAFAEFRPLYTVDGFAATTPGPNSVMRRMEEGPTWVGALNGQIAGTTAAVDRGKEGLYVRGMAVIPAARGHGIGESLLFEVERFARQSGCRRMFLSTTPFLTAAIRLYERYGFARIPAGDGDLFGTPLVTMAKELNY